MTLLADLIVYSRDGEWGQADPGPGLVKMRIVRGTDFDAFRMGDLSKMPVRYVPEKKAQQKTLHPGDILIETAGGTASRPTGRTVLVRPSTIRQSDLPLTCASFARFLRLDQHIVDPAYVYLWLDNAWQTRDLLRFNTQHTGVSRFQWTKCSETIEITLPDKEAQARISSPILALDELIENNRRRIGLLEHMARAIYDEWFVHFRYPGHEDVPVVESPLGPIPKGWAVRDLFDVAEVGFGFSFKAKHFGPTGPFGVVRIRDVPAGITKTFTDETPPLRYRIADGDVLIGMDGDFHLRQWTGGEAWLNQRVTRLRPLGDLSARHLMLAIEEAIQGWNAAIAGTTVAHLGKQHLEQIRVVIPSPDALDTATEIFAGISDQQRVLIQSSRQLGAIRDLLLPRLVTGRIDVSKLDLDELVDAVA
jgi:type I restriction enzyme S subunit